MEPIVAPGEILAERFEIIRFLAEGGMGEVYEAEDLVLGGRLALKLLSRRGLMDENVQRRFRREIQLARKVTHRNVCRIFDVFQHRPESGLLAGASISFVTMELLRGQTLEDHLEQHGPLPESEALPLIQQLAAGLGAAHAAGVVHRDFKTNNVMLEEVDGHPGLRAVITDFGLALSVAPEAQDLRKTPVTGEAQLVGTADYISPEQLQGLSTTPRSDIYALGVVMFEMVTGRKPYQAPTLMALLAKRASEPPASPQDFVPDLDPHWEQIISSCLEKDPEKRPPDTREVAASLAGIDRGHLDGSFGPEPSGVIPRPSLPRSGAASWTWRSLAAALLVTALVFLALRSSSVRDNPFQSFQPVQITTSPGLELDPTFSPDGAAIAYSSDQDGSFEIWRRDLAPGGRETRLTSDGDQLFEPAWSPDGSWIAYHSKNRGGIWVMPATAGSQQPPRRLTEFGSRPAWSPDGLSLAFQSESTPQLSDTAAPALALSTLWILGDDGQDLRQVTRVGQPPGGHGAPSWSPSGRHLVFTTSGYGSSEIWRLDLDTGAVEKLVDDPEAVYDPTWSPDGRNIYFSARDRQATGLWQLPVSGRTGRPTGPARQVANLGLASIRQLTISANGQKVAYATMSTVSNLWSLPLDPATGEPAGEARALTTGTGRTNRPAFSPDGSLLAFDRWQLGVSIDIWTLPADGGPLHQVTVETGDSSQASWLPDDRDLAFRAERDGRRGLWRVGRSGGEPELLSEIGADVFWVRLSPDGRRLAYHARVAGGGDSVWTVDLASGEKLRLTPEGVSASFPCWSRDGRWLAFQKREDGDSQVVIAPAAGGELQQLTFHPGQNWPYSFSPDGRRVAFAALRDQEWNLWWVSRDGVEQRLTPSPRLNQYYRYPAWSPAGDRIVYELAQTTGDVHMVDLSSGESR